jgi:hypothetical protein
MKSSLDWDSGPIFLFSFSFPFPFSTLALPQIGCRTSQPPSVPLELRPVHGLFPFARSGRDISCRKKLLDIIGDWEHSVEIIFRALSFCESPGR